MIFKFTLLERLLHRLHLLPTPVMDAFGGVLFGRSLAIGVRRGVFEALVGQPRTMQEIAQMTHLSSAGIQLLVEAFVAAGYLQESAGRYALSHEGEKWLVRSSPSYLGNLIAYFETLFTRWNHLEHSLEHGSPPKPYYALFDANDWKIYVYGMRDLARLLMDEVRSKIVLNGVPEALLDIGGSHGLYSIECCRSYPSLHAIVVDFAEALQYTRSILQEEMMDDRVTLLPGDCTKMNFQSGVDAVLMFNLIHGFSEQENQALIQCALNALKRGGKIFILDQMKEKERASSLARFTPLMVGLNLLNEIGGNAYTFEQVKMWCAGAAKVSRLRLRLPGVTLVEVTK
jgi:SAM-dependent methyltransferase